MKISIITVTLNNKSGLLRAIESVRSQTYKNVEHIIVDGGSTDGTVELIKNLEFRIKNNMSDMSSPTNVRDLKVSLPIDRDQNDRNQDGSERFLTPAGIRNDRRQDDKEVSSPTNVRDLQISPPIDRDQNDKPLSSDHYSLVFISEKDNGIYDAINKGIKLSTGDVIGLLHSDDFYSDEFVLEKYMKTFFGEDKNSISLQKNIGDIKDFSVTSLHQNDKEVVDAVYSDLVYVSQKSKVEDNEHPFSSIHLTDYSVIRMWKTQKEEFTTEEQRHREILKGWMPPHPTIFLRREVFEKYGLYRTDMKIAADYEMILRLFFKNKITSHYLPIITYCMTIGGASNKSLKNILRKSSEDYCAMKLHGISFPLKTLLIKNLRKLPQFFDKSN